MLVYCVNAHACMRPKCARFSCTSWHFMLHEPFRIVAFAFALFKTSLFFFLFFFLFCFVRFLHTYSLCAFASNVLCRVYFCSCFRENTDKSYEDKCMDTQCVYVYSFVMLAQRRSRAFSFKTQLRICWWHMHINKECKYK